MPLANLKCRIAIALMLVLCDVFPNHADAQESTPFKFISWFHVQPFGHKMTRVGFEGVPKEGSMPAFGFTSFFADPSGIMYFYRLNLWDGTPMLHVPIPPSENINRVTLWDVVFSTDQRFALLASDNMGLIWFDVVAGKEISRYSGHRSETFHAALSPDNKLKAATDKKGDVWIWDDALDQPTAFLPAPKTPEKIEFTETPDNVRLYMGNMIQEWNWRTGTLVKTVPFSIELDHFLNTPVGLAVSPDNSQILGMVEQVSTTTEKIGGIASLDTQTGAKKWEYAIPSENGIFSTSVWGAIFTRNGKCVIASSNRKLFAINARTGARIVETSVRVGSFDLAIDPSGRYLIFPSGVELYELPSACR